MPNCCSKVRPGRSPKPITPKPPSLFNTLPVAGMAPPRVAKNTYAPAYSAAVGTRPTGTLAPKVSGMFNVAMERASNPSATGPRKSVWIAPGATPFTLT